MKEKEAMEVKTNNLHKITNLQNQELFKLNTIKKQYDYETKVYSIDKEINEFESSLISKLILKTNKNKKNQQCDDRQQYNNDPNRLDLKLFDYNPFKLNFHKEIEHMPQPPLSLPSSTKNRTALVDKRVSVSQDKETKNLHFENASTEIGSLSISNVYQNNQFSMNLPQEIAHNYINGNNQNDCNRIQAGIKNINVSIINNSNLLIQSGGVSLGNGQLMKPLAAQSNDSGHRSSNTNNKRTSFNKPSHLNNLPDAKSMSSGKFQNKTPIQEAINTKIKKSPPDISSPKNITENGKKEIKFGGKITNSSLLLRNNQNAMNQPAPGLLSISAIHHGNRFDELTIKPNSSNINLNLNKGTSNVTTKPVLTIPNKHKDSSKDIISVISNGKAKQSDNSKVIKQSQSTNKDTALKSIKKPIAVSQVPTYSNAKFAK